MNSGSAQNKEECCNKSCKRRNSYFLLFLSAFAFGVSICLANGWVFFGS
jgi:hypothetical protein